ncbi:peroxidase activity protein [[Candida] boidinii]|uniref:Unnamed protein product n=1 Tax=Candida boidinii TaxID=5477 RepID=A0ACB5TM12_CANBO|nr:peroxidase activity protein [[Candida] boidinii]GME91372.1 unnamed protein product [[Candida] boidinii]
MLASKLITRNLKSGLRSASASSPYTRTALFNSTRFYSIKVGDKIPDVALYESNPTSEVHLAATLPGQRAIILGVPGAFSSGCTLHHIPGYLKNYPDFVSKGYSKIIVVAVNDVFTMKAWKESLNLGNANQDHFIFLADPSGNFTKALDLEFDATKFFGNYRSKRYALAVVDGKVAAEFIEPDNTSVNISAAENVLKNIPGLE